MVDTLDLKSNGHYGRAGSSPAPGTYKSNFLIIRSWIFNLRLSAPYLSHTLDRINLELSNENYEMSYFESINLIHDLIRPELFLPQITQILHRAGQIENSPCEFINL